MRRICVGLFSVSSVLIVALVLLGGVASGAKFETNSVTSYESDSCPVTSSLITWFPKEFECPICKTKNIFMVWGSYGSYIYQEPSKLQLIFWPYTDTPAWYSCKKCRLSVFMEDFDKIPPEKIAELRQMLQTTTLPKQPERDDKASMEHPPYLEIPTWARMSIAEKVYRILGKDDDEFWNHFYRVHAYHYDAYDKHAEADDARRKSIALTEKLLTDKSKDGERKESLYVLGAMKHFVRDDAGALKALQEAATLKYMKKDLKAAQNANYDAYLSQVIKEYLEMLRKDQGPRTKAAASN